MVFSLRSGLPQGVGQGLQLRVRRPLADESGDQTVPWQLRYLGQIQVSTFIFLVSLTKPHVPCYFLVILSSMDQQCLLPFQL